MENLEKTLAGAVNETPVELTRDILEGETLYISCASGSACYSSQVKVEALYKDQVFFVTHGDAERRGNLIGAAGIDPAGPGTLKLRLVNDSGSAETVSLTVEGVIS